MLNNKLLNFFIIFIFITGCAPKESAINGDVFLTMGNGTIKPIAGAEIYLFPLEVDLDSSFVDPLKLYINNAKFNISKADVEEACNEVNESMPQQLNEVSDWQVDGSLPSDLELTCKIYADKVLSLTESIASSNTNAANKAEPILASLTLKETQLQNIKEQIYRLALNQGNILKNQQMAKIVYKARTPSREVPSDASSYDLDIKTYVNIKNNSDYLVLSVTFDRSFKVGERIFDKNYKNDPYLLKLFEYTEPYRGSFIDSYSDTWTISSYDLQTKNSYNESIPGLSIGTAIDKQLYDQKIIENWYTTSDRWLDENKSSIKVIPVGCKRRGTGSYYPQCKPNQYVYIDFGYPSIEDINFGEPIKKVVDEGSQIVSYISAPVDWVAKGRMTSEYKNSDLHSQLKKMGEEISNILLSIDSINEEFNISSLTAEKDTNQYNKNECDYAIDVRDTQVEVKSCLANLENPDALVSSINSSKTLFGYEIKEIFNSVTEDDLGYDNFEQLLNAYGQSRNAIKAVTSIQGGYEFLTVPNGNYVLFTYYEDRFNGVGHWFEEITVEDNQKIDLNNLNYKKEGVYSYLRDKIEE